MKARMLRRLFLAKLGEGLREVWPVVSGLLALMVVLGIIVGRIEGWSLGESLYFAFISGLTIGYGDLAPKAGLGRVLAVAIGMLGILLTGLIAAVSV
ncbi:MAG TPA: potassium channel family protein [Steroidobacteraceae bacterium]|nr:potassium channel family protein [Steroidobacteraceae bacterium]